MNNKLNINCPIGGTGYGITSLNIAKSLHDLDLDISLFVIGNNIQLNSPEEKNIIGSMIENGSKYDPYAPCLKIWHQNDLASRIGIADFYAFPFFEVDTISEKEKHHLNNVDYIFVASNWAKNILVNNGVTKPIYVAPLGVDTDVFKIPNKIKIKNNNYVFFHIGKWEKRKAQDFLIKAFDNAFDINDNVELWMLPHNPFLSKEEETEWLKLAGSAKLKDKIKIYDRLPTQHHLAQFIFEGDCGIFPSRAEGWNNEIPECMALNKPVIATNYSAHTEYCNSDNCYLIDIDSLEKAEDNKWFKGEGNWAKLGDNQMEQTVKHMRFVYNNNITSNNHGIETAQYLSWKRTSAIINETLTRNRSYAYPRKKPKRR